MDFDADYRSMNTGRLVGDVANLNAIHPATRNVIAASDVEPLTPRDGRTLDTMERR